jgi:hypothetical protein
MHEIQRMLVNDLHDARTREADRGRVARQVRRDGGATVLDRVRGVLAHLRQPANAPTFSSETPACGS